MNTTLLHPTPASLDTDQHHLHTIVETLHYTYGIVPIVAGLDKFTNLLTHWSNYLNPSIARMFGDNPQGFMKFVGVVEIVAGIIVLGRPKLGAMIVAAWLTLIALSLIAFGSYLDVAVRDLVMAIGALTLARLVKPAET